MFRLAVVLDPRFKLQWCALRSETDIEIHALLKAELMQTSMDDVCTHQLSGPVTSSHRRK